MVLFSFEICLILTWSVNCVIPSNTVANQTTTFAISNAKINVPVVYQLKIKYYAYYVQKSTDSNFILDKTFFLC